VEVREKNSSKGKKGTIIGNWTYKKKSGNKIKHNKLFLLFIFFLTLVLVLLIKKYFF